MRRVVAVAVLGVMASGLLSLTAVVRADSLEVSPTLSPPVGREAVRDGDTLTVGGVADPQATLVHAELRFLDAADEAVREPLDTTGSVRLDGGGITGAVALPQLCPDPASAQECRQRLNGGSVVLAVTVERDAQQARGVSNAVPIDLAHPYILRTSLIQPDRVEVRFSEPVSLPQGSSDSPLDWTIDGSCNRGRPATAVETVQGHPELRVLTIALAEDEDATPAVSYCPPFNRPYYRDRAQWSLVAGWLTTAVDRVAPKVPVVTEMANRVGKTVVANDPSPVVRLAGLRPGHFGQVYLEGGNQAGFQRLEDTLLGEAQAGQSGTADVQIVQDLGADGAYTLYGVARDNAKCSSEGTTICPNFSGGDAATYNLDMRAPVPASTVTEGPQVHVTFSEEVTGDDDPNDWSVTPGGPVASVTGAGKQRTLTVANAPASALVTYTNPGDGTGYHDAAGNAVASFQVPADDKIPPVITVSDPVTTTWTTANTHLVTGSVSKPGSRIDALQGNVVVATHDLGDAQTDFSLDVPLAKDRGNSFTLRATDELGNVNRQDTFLPPIIQDSTDPTVKVLAPTKDDVLAGGTPFSIRWDAADANFGSGPVSIFFSSGGAPWDQVSANEANDGDFSWIVPGTSVEDAQIRIVATDRVGYTAEDVSALFSIDAEPPVFAAVTSDPRHVAVRFTEPVTGTIAADEWTIDGIPAAGAQRLGAQAAAADMDLNSIVLETIPTQTIGRNAIPVIGYAPRDIPGRQQFHDQAGNLIPDGARAAEADDGIAPLAPAIETIAGQPANNATSDDPSPELEIGGVDEGDRIDVFVESDGNAGLTGGDPLVGSAVAGPDGATLTTEDLGPDGDYRLYATASDTAGNESPDAAEALYKLRTPAVPPPPPVVLPPAPVISEIAGRPASGSVTANDPTPEVKVGNIDEGNTAEIYVESDGQTGLGAGDPMVGSAVAGGDGALVETSTLTPEGTYVLYAATRDAAGHRSAGADDATYVLDMTGPAISAAVTDERHILVTFTEPVTGTLVEAEWKIDGTPANTTQVPGQVAGLKTFTFETVSTQTIPAGYSPLVSYEPPGAGWVSAPGELRDAAGNTLRQKITRAAALPVPGQPSPAPPPPNGQPGGGSSGGGDPKPGDAGASEEKKNDPGICDLLGTEGDDLLTGTDGPDVICPLGGNDRIMGMGGDDIILGGTGPKVIDGGDGDDVLRGGRARDVLRGGLGNDTLVSEHGRDILMGQRGHDRLNGGRGTDKLSGGPGTDTCAGGAGSDSLRSCEGGRVR